MQYAALYVLNANTMQFYAERLNIAVQSTLQNFAPSVRNNEALQTIQSYVPAVHVAIQDHELNVQTMALYVC